MRRLRQVIGLCLSGVALGAAAAPAPFTIGAGRVRIPPDSLFAREIFPQPIESRSQLRSLRLVGQVLALANHSASLANADRLAWAELSPALSRQVGIDFSTWKGTPGMAIGVVWAPPELLKHIAIGQPIAIGRYGLRRSQMPGTVLSIGDNPMPSPDGTLTVPVLFRLGSGQTWYPGTNCEVEFPIGVGKAFHLPSTAVLHEGSREYVFKELGSGEYAPQSVAIIDESENSAEVLGNLKPSDRIVARGAILLKPILSVLLNQPQAPEGPAQNR